MTRTFLESARAEFVKMKQLADNAIAQVEDHDFTREPSAGANSIALVMKHLAGNMRSRWTDFLTTDGEKPDRNRDSEFRLEPGDTPSSLKERWRAGWACFFDAIEPLTEADLDRVVTIRGEPHTVLQAIQRQVAHYGYHVGQIVMLAKVCAGPRWVSLSIAPGQSSAFNRDMRARFQSES